MTFEPQLDLPSGEHYIMDNKEYVVDERRGDKVLFKEVGGNIFGSLDDSELKEKFSAGSIVPIPSAHRGKALSEIIANRRRQLGAFPEKQQKIALKKLDYFKAINNAP
ncbi:MAG: hypothetical protein OEY85_15285, partial [Rhodospirillales bacterium]|nr:hypothetical protein [Rhodospirillales bacterium]